MMDLHVFLNDGHRILFEEHFRPSLQDNFCICEHQLGNRQAADFGTLSFKQVILEKMTSLVDEILPAARPDVPFILSDVDIQFFQPCEPNIRQALEEADIAFQREQVDGDEVNTGFVAMRATEQVVAFWTEVKRRIETSAADEFINEQKIANDLLSAGFDIRWTVFPNEIWAWSNTATNLRQESLKNIVLHHANCTIPQPGKSSLDLKIEQLDQVKARLQWWNCSGPTLAFRRVKNAVGNFLAKS